MILFDLGMWSACISTVRKCTSKEQQETEEPRRSEPVQLPRDVLQTLGDIGLQGST